MTQAAFFRNLNLMQCLISILLQAGAQTNNCTLKPPFVAIHFGQGNVKDINTAPLANYERVSGSCPTDGHYTFCASTPGCFRGDWFTLTEDHTPGDQNGNMMLVNAYPGGGVFFNHTISGGLRSGATYELALWVINVCRLHVCCSDLSPSIHVVLTTTSGKKIAGFFIDGLNQTETPRWKKYNAFFTLPAGEHQLVLTMQDNAIGGCGNDFALDDITVRECVKPMPVITAAKPKTVQSPAKKIVVNKVPVRPIAIKRTKQPVVPAGTKKDSLTKAPAPVQSPKAYIPVPLVLRTRANPLVKQIEVPAGEIRIDLYDNGEIDGDTVSVYHNNELIVSKAGLSQKPVSFRIMVDAEQPHHELVMVANNLGSIPPNTSLMIVTVGDKRYQVFISSSEQKNAKLVIDLKE